MLNELQSLRIVFQEPYIFSYLIIHDAAHCHYYPVFSNFRPFQKLRTLISNLLFHLQHLNYEIKIIYF